MEEVVYVRIERIYIYIYQKFILWRGIGEGNDQIFQSGAERPIKKLGIS